MAIAAARKINWFAVWVSAAVVVALVALAAIVVTANMAEAGPGTAPSASNIDQGSGAIVVGDGANTLDTYIDFQCPVCQAFESTYGEEIQGLVDDGTITLNIHPISILDRFSGGTQYSTRSASAMYCVAENDPTAALPFMQALYANQPEENTTGLTDEQIATIAEQAGATNSASCISDGTYTQFVASKTQDTPVQPGAQGISTPTIEVNGEVISNQTLPAAGSLATLFG